MTRRLAAWLTCLLAAAQPAAAQDVPALGAEETRRILAHGPWPSPWKPDPSNRVSGNPAAAVVLFAADTDLSIIFATHPTRKYKNLKANPRAAFAMTKGMTALQAHGAAEELSGASARAASDVFFQKHPEMDQHLVEGSVFFRFKPDWARYMDMGAMPWEQWEVAFETR